MKPYRFRLMTLQRVRERNRDALRQQLGDANRAAAVLQEEADRIEGEIEQARQQVTATTREATLNVNAILQAQRYELLLQTNLQDIAGKLQEVEKEIERRRLAVVEAEREVRVLEILDEKGREKHRQELMVAEQKITDEVASNLIWRRRAKVEAAAERDW